MYNSSVSIRCKKIRPKQINDIWYIIELNASLLKSQGHNDWSNYYSKEILLKMTAYYTMFCIYIDMKPVATFSLTNKTPDYYSKSDLSKFTKTTNKAFYISSVAVLPKLHRQGIGKLILKKINSYSLKQNTPWLRLDARNTDKALINFYLSNGFTNLGPMTKELDYSLFEKEVSK